MQRFLLTNGLGGYASLTRDFIPDRREAGVFVAALQTPELRINMVSGMQETLDSGEHFILQHFSVDPAPCWIYKAGDALVQRQLALGYGENTAALSYRIENTGRDPVIFTATPVFKLSPTDETIQTEKQITADACHVSDGAYTLYIKAAADTCIYPARWHTGQRPETGLGFTCLDYCVTVNPGQVQTLELTFGLQQELPAAETVIRNAIERKKKLLAACPFHDPMARHLYMAADAYIVDRQSAGGKTILAGYPLPANQGSDAILALTGCALSTGRYSEAKSILKTFLAYHFFPKDGAESPYHRADAALLLFDGLWQYYLRTQDEPFVREAYPVLEQIIKAYRAGAVSGIGMDADGLLFAGEEKPVALNAYWYNALQISDRFAALMGCDGADHAALAEKVKKSFLEKFPMEEKGYLKNTLSGADADAQLQWNQLLAVSLSFTMPDSRWEKNVVEAVEKQLLTKRGLRDLSGGALVFPMAVWCRAFLKTGGQAEALLDRLCEVEDMLTEGCLGQLPEIYDGHQPHGGCYALAQSVGEMLRVYEELEKTV